MPLLSSAGVDVDRRLADDEEIPSSFRTDVSDSEDSSDSDDEDDDSSSISDCESVTSRRQIVEHVPGAKSSNTFIDFGLVRLDETDKLHEIIRKKFTSRLNSVGIDARIQYIHRNMFNRNAIAQARLGSFQIFKKSVEKKNGGDANIKYAWFGASKDQISKIILHGFGFDNVQKIGSFGHGIVLSADHSPRESVESATADEDEIKHILLCRVLLGKSELVNPDSMQCYPSSEDFQSGVDDILSPKKYIVWINHMNTHILPEFLISFKNNEVRFRKPVSPWIPIPSLIAELSKILSPKAMKEIIQFRYSYIDHKISRRDMIRGIREVTGDTLLLMVLKDFTKQRQANRIG